MATIIDLKVKIGNSSSMMHELPCAIDSPSPIISWEPPSWFDQKRFNIRIQPVDGSGLFINGSLESSQTTFQYPTTSQMSARFYGLCKLDIALSEKTSGEYEYASETLYFVFDNVLEILRTSDRFVFRWNNSSDAETPWQDMKYNLVVSSSPLFEEENIIFDGMVNATTKNETSRTVMFDDVHGFVYWKVRAFDGLDYGDFSRINAFRMTDNNPPNVTINSIDVYNDSERDVAINVTIDDSDRDRLNLEVYYNGGSVGDKYTLASLVNSVVCVKPGTYKIIWRSSLDEKKISSNDYRIRIIAIDDGGLYGSDTSDTFMMDNLAIGADTGGEASINNYYTVKGKMAVVNTFIVKDDRCPVGGKITIASESYKEEQAAILGNNETFKTYRTGGLKYPLMSKEKENGSSNPDDWVMGGGSGDEEEVEPEYPKGMLLFQGESNPPDGEDLDSGDPNFIRDTVHVDENGNFWEMDEMIRYRSVRENVRQGYARFLDAFYAFSGSKCPTCGGKGWNGVVEDENIPHTHKYRYKRKVCGTCLGNRFIEPNIEPKKVSFTRLISEVKRGDVVVLKGGKRLILEGFAVICPGVDISQNDYRVDTGTNSITFNINAKDVVVSYKMEKYEIKNELFMVSKWIPIENYFYPLSKTDLIHNCKIGDSKIIEPMVDFVFNPTMRQEWFSTYQFGESNSQSGLCFKRKELPNNVYYQVDCPLLSNKIYNMFGTYNGTYFTGRLGVKKENAAEKENYRLTGNAHVVKFPLKEHVSRVTGMTNDATLDYVPGTTYDESVFASGRKIPTWKWEPGLFVLTGSLYRENELSPLKIIFLQSNWQVYNTIHWSGPGTASTLTQVQYCRVNENGSNGVFYDVISENSDYYSEQGIWLVPPQTWHCYWRTEDQIQRDNTSRYRLRIRQYNIVSKTFTQWSYSETTFTFNDGATNPANIYYTEYRKFSKKLYIYYRLDDKDWETFDIVSVSYRVDGGNWININDNYLEGERFFLSSIPGDDGNGNKHLIVWDTSSFNLAASDDYRIRIEVIKTKLASGYSEPVLKWIKTPNTTVESKETDISTYSGTWVRFYFDTSTGKKVSLNQPVYVPGTIKEIEDKIFEIKCQNEPLPSGCNGYFSFVRGVDIVKDGDNIVSANVTDAHVENSIIVDGTEYFLSDWLNYKINGISRNTLIYNYSDEIQQCIKIVNNARDVIDEAIKHTRRSLIDQGYYCNGFKNNTPTYITVESSNSVSEEIDENSYFKFRVLTYFEDNVDENGFVVPKYSEYLGDVLFSKTISDTSGGQTKTETFYFHEYERTSDIFTRIVLDRFATFNSQNGKPMRDMIFDEYGERIVTNVGGDNYIDTEISKPNNSFAPIPTNNTEDDTVSANNYAVNKTNFETFTIPESMYPGERDGDIPYGDTFDGDYSWKVSSYNLLYGRPEEEPEFSATSTFNRDIVSLTIKTKAPSGLVSATVSDIYYIDKIYDKYLIDRDCSNSASRSYFDENNYLFGNEIVTETVFVTDPSDHDIDSGYCSDFIWTPLSKHRTRPVVFVDDDDEKHFWYIKENNSENKIICYAKGKTFFRVGEYDTAIPASNNDISSELDDVEDIFCHSVIKVGDIYMMYYIQNTSSGYVIGVSTSTDAHKWTHGNASIPRSGVYNIFATREDGVIKMYYCAHDNGVFSVYSSMSNDGTSFTNEELVFSSPNVISNIFMLSEKGVMFYTEETEENGEYHYCIKNNSGGIFPIIDNASNPYIINDGLGYRIFFDRGGKICSVFVKNYIEKNIVKDSRDLRTVVSGDLTKTYSSPKGTDNLFSINRAYQSWGTTLCTDEFRTMDLNNILGWVVVGKNNDTYKEYMIEGPFLTNENKSEVKGEMEPYPFKYMSIIKDKK